MVSKMESKTLLKTMGFLLFRVKTAWNIFCFAKKQSKLKMFAMGFFPKK